GRRNDRGGNATPSAESGGVPDPTEAYLLRASFLHQPSLTVRPLLVVIDLNGTLLFRPGKKDNHSFIERPHARKFIKYCINTFHVVIWSSAQPGNVQKMCAQLLDQDDHAKRVVAAWGRDKFGLSPSDYKRKVQVYKRLTLLWNDPKVQASHPNAAQGEVWNQGNTVLIDDSTEKARSEPYNAITIPEFLGDPENEDQDVLPLVHEYLNRLAMVTDVSTYIRVHPFKI
ncbi:HAD-like domain-containing protein, partial [Podospora australis]